MEENNGNKYLTLIYPNNAKDVLKQYKEIWNKNKYLIKLKK